MASPTHPRRAASAYRVPSPGTPPQSVAAFISKVWNILDNREYEKLISWSEVCFPTQWIMYKYQFLMVCTI